MSESTGKTAGKHSIYYLGHSAWAVLTETGCMLFDCQNHNSAPGDLSDGVVDLQQFGSLPVYVFYSHSHHDHYSRKLHRLSENFNNVTTVLGDFSVETKKNTVTLKPREKQEIGGITVYTGASTDIGVCWMVQIDGLVIFFAGDHADWGDGDETNRLYYNEIDYMAGLGLSVDIAFIPVCNFMGQRPADMTKGAIYAVNALKPAVTYPMHGNGREYLYKEFEKDLRQTGNTSRVVCAERPGLVE